MIITIIIIIILVIIITIIIIIVILIIIAIILIVPVQPFRSHSLHGYLLNREAKKNEDICTLDPHAQNPIALQHGRAAYSKLSIYIYIYMHTHIHIIERERERERDVCVYIYIYILSSALSLYNKRSRSVQQAFALQMYLSCLFLGAGIGAVTDDP